VRGLRHFSAAGAVLACLLAAACSAPAGPEGTACTALASASAIVSVVDGAGLPLPGAAVAWRVGGGEQHAAECADPSLGPASCWRFVAGWEVEGRIDVLAEKPGWTPASAAAVVFKDAAGCHVVTQQILITLSAR
jgi:hypothetical protein